MQDVCGERNVFFSFRTFHCFGLGFCRAKSEGVFAELGFNSSSTFVPGHYTRPGLCSVIKKYSMVKSKIFFYSTHCRCKENLFDIDRGDICSNNIIINNGTVYNCTLPKHEICIHTTLIINFAVLHVPLSII